MRAWLDGMLSSHLHKALNAATIQLTTMVRYLTFSISICFISWLVGMMIHYALRKRAYFNKNLENLTFIENQHLNRVIGLGIFKWIVRNTFFKFFNQKLKLKTKIDKPYLCSIRKEMTISEIDHLIGFVFVSFFALAKAFNANYLFGLVIMIVNIPMNLYPSLLQQENKRRIDRLIKRL